MKLNEKIAWYRRDKKLSQEELAAQVGVSRQAVSKWELGEASPDVNKLLALSRAFGVTTDHLLNEEEGPEREAPPAVERPVPPPPPAPSGQGQFSNLPGFLGKMVRRWGWLAGIYLALQGAGVALVGFIAHWGFGSMFRTTSQMMSGFDDFGMGGGWTYDGPPELEGAVMDALGIDAMGFAPAASPFSGFERFVLGITTLILVVGIVMIVGGLILAYILWKNGKNGD